MHFNPYGEIPEFFQAQCQNLKLPLIGITGNVSAFVSAVLSLENRVDRIRMHRYLADHYNFLACYLQVLVGVSPEHSREVGKTVLGKLQEAEIPLTYGTLNPGK